MPPRRTWLWLVALVVVNYFLVRTFMPGPEDPLTIPYTFFKDQVTKGNVEAIHAQGEAVRGRFKTAITYPPAADPSTQAGGDSQADKKSPPPTTRPGERPAPSRTSQNFTTAIPTFVSPGLEELLISHGVQISAKPIDEPGSPWATLLFGFGPALLFIGFYVWMFRRAQQGGGGLMGGGLMGIGKSRARRYDQESDAKVTFNDVAGIDEAENELVEIVDFLKDPPKYTRLGGTAPKPRPRVCCWSALPVPARPCSRARSPARPACRSSR
jgi:cell division protease FtsH